MYVGNWWGFLKCNIFGKFLREFKIRIYCFCFKRGKDDVDFYGVESGKILVLGK